MRKIIALLALLAALALPVSATAGKPSAQRFEDGGGGCPVGAIEHRTEIRYMGVGYGTWISAYYCNANGHWEYIGGWWG